MKRPPFSASSNSNADIPKKGKAVQSANQSDGGISSSSTSDVNSDSDDNGKGKLILKTGKTSHNDSLTATKKLENRENLYAIQFRSIRKRDEKRQRFQQAVLEDSSTSSISGISNSGTRRKVQQNMSEKLIPTMANTNLKTTQFLEVHLVVLLVVMVTMPAQKGKVSNKTILIKSNFNSENAVSACKTSENSSDSTSSSEDDADKNSKSAVQRKVPERSSSDNVSSSDDDVSKSSKSAIQGKVPKEVISVMPHTKLSECSSDSSSSSEDDKDKNSKLTVQKKVPDKAIPTTLNTTLKGKVPKEVISVMPRTKLSECSSDSSSSSEDDADKNSKLAVQRNSEDDADKNSKLAVQKKVPDKATPTTLNTTLKNMISTNKTCESSSDGVSSSDDDANKNSKSAAQRKCSSDSSSSSEDDADKNSKLAVQKKSSSDGVSSSDDDANKNSKSAVQRKVPKNAKKVPDKAIPTTLNTTLKNMISTNKTSESSSDGVSSSDDDANKNSKSAVQGKVPEEVISVMPHTKLSERSSDSSSSSEDDADKSLRSSMHKKVLGKVVPTISNSGLKSGVSASRGSKSLSDSTSSSDNDMDINLDLSMKQSISKYPAVKKSGNSRIMRNQKTVDVISSDFSDSDSISTMKPGTNMQQKPSVALNDKLQCAMKSSSSSSDSDQLDRYEKTKKTITVATKIGGNKNFVNEDTSSFDSNNGSDKMKKVQVATAINIKQLKKTSKPMISQSNVKSVSSDSSSDSEIVLAERTTRKKQFVRPQNQPKVIGNQKLMDSNPDDDNFSDGVGGEIAETKIFTVDNKAPSRKADNSLGSSSLDKATTISSKFRTERNSETSSDSDSDGTVMKWSQSQIAAGIQNTKFFDTKASAKSLDIGSGLGSDMLAAKKRNVKAISKKAVDKASEGDSDFTKQAKMKQRELIPVTGEIDSDSSSGFSESDTKCLIAMKAEKSFSMKKTSSDSLSNDGDIDNNKRKPDSTEGKIANFVETKVYEKNQSQTNVDVKKEGKNTDLREEDDNEQKRIGNNQNAFGNARNDKRHKIAQNEPFRLQNEPFRRVKISKDELEDKFRDNSYRTKTYDQWGKKAYEDMKNVQGKGFRHEKTKKKRGSYGGSGTKIDTSCHSIKFSSDSD
ncbi:Eukaryotic translation initiation factor 2-alpha kinase 1 [Dirofilaria immitis]|nr:Eukaryotic translation initiation factor 2-alpha kinase 1 [Dirofilaria immitis]